VTGGVVMPENERSDPSKKVVRRRKRLLDLHRIR